MNKVPQRRLLRRIERWLVGLAFAIIAFVIEKVVFRSIRRAERTPSSGTPPELSGPASRRRAAQG
jgi:hypothetical protein